MKSWKAIEALKTKDFTLRLLTEQIIVSLILQKLIRVIKTYIMHNRRNIKMIMVKTVIKLINSQFHRNKFKIKVEKRLKTRR